MNLSVLNEIKLKQLERALVEKANEIEIKQEKTALDYAVLLETVVECRKIQAELFAIKTKRKAYSSDELEAFIAEYRKYENMPCRELFFNRGNE